MNIPYTYTVTSVNPDARVMEVVYESPGRQTVHVGARLPFTGESLDDVVHLFAPLGIWSDQDAAVVVPEVGASGQFVPPDAVPTTLGTAKQRKAAEIAAWRYAIETKGVSVAGVRVSTDRESQATISGAYASLRDGLIQSVDWKSESGTFVTLGLPEITVIAQAVAQHVQASFTREKDLLQQLAPLDTVEAVQALAVPWGEVNNSMNVVVM